MCLCVLLSSGGYKQAITNWSKCVDMNLPAWIWSTASAEETAVTGTMIADTKHSPHTPVTRCEPGMTTTPLLVRRQTEWQRTKKRWREESEMGKGKVWRDRGEKGCKHQVNNCLLWNGKHRAAPTVALVTPWESDCWHQTHTAWSKQALQLLLGHLSTGFSVKINSAFFSKT